MIKNSIMIILAFLLGINALYGVNANYLTPNQTIKNGNLLSYDIIGQESYQDQDGSHDTIQIGDGNVSDIWEFVPTVEVPSFGSLGRIGSVYGQEYIYFFIVFDISYSWAAVQWDSDGTGDPEVEDNGVEPMELNDDVWVFGVTEYSGVIGDSHSAGQGQEPYMYQDQQNDLIWERIVISEGTEDNLVQYNVLEIKRKLDTQDVEGRDVKFSIQNNVTVMMASSVYHGLDSLITQMKFAMVSETVNFNAPAPILRQARLDILNGRKFVILNLQRGLLLGIILQLVIGLLVFLKSRRIQ